MKKYLMLIALGLMIIAEVASAAFINGSISISGGFDNLPASTTSIVSELTAFDVSSIAVVLGTTGDFVGTTSATPFDFDTGVLPSAFFNLNTGFSLELTSATVAGSSSLNCGSALCSDLINLSVEGFVSGAGFDDTAFLGTWIAQGSCIASSAGNTCAGGVIAQWATTISSAPPTPAPEPSSLVLLGLGLAGIGYQKRKQQIKAA